MRRLTLCLALIVLPCAFGEDKPDAKGVKTTTKDGKVTAVFPHKPTEKKVATTMIVGQGDLTLYLYESKDGKSAFGLHHRTMPTSIDLSDKTPVKKILDVVREGVIRSLKGKFLSKKDLTLGKYPGQTFDFEASIGICRARIYLTEKSIVQIIIVGPKEFIDGPEAKKFLDSLKIEK